MTKTIEKTKTGYKKTELGWIPEDWEFINIFESSTLKARIGWQGLTTAEYKETGDYYLITGTDFINGKIKWDTCHYVEKNRYDQDKNIQLKLNDILITKDGTIGKIAFIDNLPKEATLNSGVFVVRPKEKSYLPYYLIHILNSNYFSIFLYKLKTGSTISHLYQKDFVNFKFPIPLKLAEQQKIAEILTCWNKAIEKTENLIEAKTQLKKGLMQKLLTGKVRFKEFVKEEGFKKTKIGLVPKDWEIKKLHEIAKRVTRKNDGNKYEILTISSLAGFLNQSDRFNKVIAGNSLDNYTFLFKNEFAYNKGNSKTYPYGCIFRLEDYEKALIPNVYISFGMFNVSTDYYKHCFIKGMLERQLKRIISSGARNDGLLNVAPAEFFKCLVIYPPIIEEQQKIAAVLTTCDKEIELLNKQLDTLKEEKKSLMQKLLTGQVRVKVEN